MISNPPYFVDSAKSGKAARDAARHTDGLPLGESARCAFALGQRLAVVLPTVEGREFLDAAQALGWHLQRQINVVGRVGKPVERLLLELSKAPGDVTISELIIEAEPRVYTEAYRQLARDFYLKF